MSVNYPKITNKENLTENCWGIEGVIVDYDKGQEKSEKLDSYSNSRLTYSQKPDSFSHENEFRFVFIRKACTANNLTLKLERGIGGGLIHEYT